MSKSHGTTTLLAAVSVGVDDRDRIGVVGRNGAGKSTLLRLLTGDLTPDSGRVATAALRTGLLGQGDELPSGTVRDVVVGARSEHEWASVAGARDAVTGLGLADRLDADTSTLSGGERRRVALAALLVADSLDGLDLLALDEPTNHLDVAGVAWLAERLKARRRALVVVTHDRWFLDEICDTTWEIADGKVHSYVGGYAAYVLARAERERVAAATEARRQTLLRKELAWLRRGPPARTAKPRFRIEAANALIAGQPPARETLRLRRAAAVRLGRRVIDVDDVSLTVGGRRLLRGVTWRLGPGERTGVVGVNGSGKTSLLRVLTGDLPPDSGTVRRGATVRLGYLPQQAADIDPALRVLEAAEEVGRVLAIDGGTELTAGQLLESFGFPAAKQWTRVADLSGGERRRLQLLRLLLAGSNVLLLDEPTNDLDIETLRALEDLLDGWPGTLVVVTHDRYFLERVCDSVQALVGAGQLAALPGGVEEYLARLRDRRDREGEQTAPARRRSGDTRAEERRLRREASRLEGLLDRLARREADLHAELAAHASEHEIVLRLDAELRGLLADKSAAEEAWLAAAEQLEDL
ncbi:MAG: ABC-F family ATP-binding cassette domain-containing protein [Frankiaceae bacterium]